MKSDLSQQQIKALELLRRYGRNAYSFEILEPGLSYWFNQDESACVAYVDQGWYWIGAGGPICRRESLAQISNEFAEAAKKHHRRTVFFGVSDRYLEAVPEFDNLQVGQQPCWNPLQWDTAWKKSGKVRNRVNKAVKAGIKVRNAGEEELEPGRQLRLDAERLINDWVQEHAMPPMHFMVTLEIFSFGNERKYFIAEQEAELVGLLSAVPIYGRQGWLIEDMIVRRGTAGGTAEALIDAAMRNFAAEGTSYATLGLVALAGVSRQSKHVFLSLLLNFCYRYLNWLYSFQGLYAFRSKFHPAQWEAVYLASPQKIDWLTVRAVLMAFAGGWLPTFAGRSAARWLGKKYPRLFSKCPE